MPMRSNLANYSIWPHDDVERIPNGNTLNRLLGNQVWYRCQRQAEVDTYITLIFHTPVKGYLTHFLHQMSAWRRSIGNVYVLLVPRDPPQGNDYGERRPVTEEFERRGWVQSAIFWTLSHSPENFRAISATTTTPTTSNRRCRTALDWGEFTRSHEGKCRKRFHPQTISAGGKSRAGECPANREFYGYLGPPTWRGHLDAMRSSIHWTTCVCSRRWCEHPGGSVWKGAPAIWA